MPLREMENLVQVKVWARPPGEPVVERSGFLCWFALCYLEAIQYLH